MSLCTKLYEFMHGVVRMKGGSLHAQYSAKIFYLAGHRQKYETVTSLFINSKAYFE